MSESKEQLKEDTIQEPTQASAGQQKQPLTRQQRIERWFEVVTAIMLGVVAVATAWSGYRPFGSFLTIGYNVPYK